MWATVEKEAEDLSVAVVTRITNRHAAHGLTTLQTFSGSDVTVAAAVSSGRMTGSSRVPGGVNIIPLPRSAPKENLQRTRVWFSDPLYLPDDGQNAETYPDSHSEG